MDDAEVYQLCAQVRPEKVKRKKPRKHSKKSLKFMQGHSEDLSLLLWIEEELAKLSSLKT